MMFAEVAIWVRSAQFRLGQLIEKICFDTPTPTKLEVKPCEALKCESSSKQFYSSAT